MCKCKKCGNEFQVPKYAIQMIFATYCKPCIIKRLKAHAKLSPKEVIEMECKSLGLWNHI